MKNFHRYLGIPEYTEYQVCNHWLDRIKNKEKLDEMTAFYEQIHDMKFEAGYYVEVEFIEKKKKPVPLSDNKDYDCVVQY